MVKCDAHELVFKSVCVEAYSVVVFVFDVVERMNEWTLFYVCQLSIVMSEHERWDEV